MKVFKQEMVIDMGSKKMKINRCIDSFKRLLHYEVVEFEYEGQRFSPYKQVPKPERPARVNYWL